MVLYFELVFLVGLLIYMIYCNCRVARRLGHDPLNGLLLSVPILSFFLWSAWAFNESPNERLIAKLRRQLAEAQAKYSEPLVIIDDE